MKKFNLYKTSVILFFLIIPVISILLEITLFKNSLNIILILKWFTFCMVGLRLLTAGIKQILNPSFTATKIFDIKDKKALYLVKEIGFSNVSIGTIGIVSLFVNLFIYPAAVCGGIYLGLAGLGHILGKQIKTEYFAMITDLFACLVILSLCLLSIIV